MPPRVAIDTSVVGGVKDPSFATDSRQVFDEAVQGSLVLLISDVLVAELSGAPEEIRRVIENLPAAAVELVPLDRQAEELRDAYLAAKVVDPRRRLDAAHVAIAAIAGATPCSRGIVATSRASVGPHLETGAAGSDHSRGDAIGSVTGNPPCPRLRSSIRAGPLCSTILGAAA